ncbi:hypothetical protein A1Q1_04491 [Trichosporon asahii var. asahii CBS 2479]|uniref:Thioredoxin domain-containing protein n=1 Tax=Trichosporon asahii var. asahii (strain ATCC 90039 / CBS 2479 / JCM 2466 / KCTC 7840 / NBRC 103889/ NCYC 2677 / UAMH 7654) TaxID=1186058 RepID=J5QDK3_TRIAS|nr:hypothetical protein A1Q1_04491 [Trichosporon asahii var. asahii CBS 2479]EJT46813.1 hypothetical protein A1Q1_04491 [Trichosporon asahii var. asahii CBS 2479]
MSLLRSSRVASGSLRTATRGFTSSAIRRDHFLNASDSEFKARCVDDKSDKPVLVDFYATWCQPCRVLTPLLKEVTEPGSGYDLMTINVDDHPDLAGQFKDQGAPDRPERHAARRQGADSACCAGRGPSPQSQDPLCVLESEPRLLKKLGAMGLSATQDELITSIGACRALCEKRGLRYVLFAPLPTDNSPYLLLSPEAAEEFANVPTSPPYDAVVIGLHPPSFAYEPLNTAFRVLTGEPLRDAQPADRKPVLIAPHTAAYLQAPAEGPFPAGLSLGIGAYVAALETAANTQAEVVGKPTRAFFELALEKLGLQKDVEKGEVAIVGDDVKNDLGAGARELGLQRVLVKTGKYRPGDEDGAQPDRVHETFADFVDALLQEHA